MSCPCVRYLAVLIFCCVNASHNEPEVKSPAGTFRGKILTSSSGEDYASYRGIRFALPPTGERRFSLPVPFPTTEAIYDATEFGPICLQNINGSPVGKEDCLRINIFTPIGSQKTKADDQKKVYVFIHGGGISMGSANIYLPGDFVTKGDVIVVTMSYRLNWLGFLRGNSTSLPGNLGFYDQLMALKWVKANIEDFGGDPNDVTLSGESSGSLSVSVLCVSPLSKGLFSKAHLMSLSSAAFPSIDRASNDLLKIAAKRVGCGEDVTGNEDSVVACLRQVPGEMFVQNFDASFIIRATSSGNDLLPRPFIQLLEDTDYLSDLGFFDRDYLGSITREEGSIITMSIFGEATSFSSCVQTFVTWLRLPEPVVKSVLLEYQKLYGKLEDASIAIATDYVFLMPTIHFIDAVSLHQRQRQQTQGHNTYFMLFDHKPRFVPHQYMLHALDLEYLFDAVAPGQIINTFYPANFSYFYSEDFVLKNEFLDLVADFVKTRNPGLRLAKNKSIIWPSYDSDKKRYLRFSLQPSVDHDIVAKRHMIWEKLVPKWLEESKLSNIKLEL